MRSRLGALVLLSWGCTGASEPLDPPDAALPGADAPVVVWPLCTPGETHPCYGGAAGTEDVGPCRAGTSTCNAAGDAWGDCEGEVAPRTEACGNAIDDDCNGAVDDENDFDGDGWTNCQGDCCDSTGVACGTPVRVNPGAFEAPGNRVDDDCNGTVDEVMSDCDAGLASGSSDAMDYARAIDLCRGVISATLTLPSGTGTPDPSARSIRPSFGSGTVPQGGSSLVVLSTGRAAAMGDTSPDFAAFQGGQNLSRTSAVPTDWLAAHAGNFPNAPGCPDPAGGAVARDPIMLSLRLQVPTNARSFELATNFLSSEYPEWVCSPYNDFFVVLLDSSFTGDPANPADKNLARYLDADGNEYPLGVNLSFGGTGLFRQCLNGPTGCGTGATAGDVETCESTAGLAGTGFDAADPPAKFANDPGWCGVSNLAGGGTGWLVTRGNVVPGEIIDLRIAIWDTGDPWYDSVALIDRFTWQLDPSDPGTETN